MSKPIKVFNDRFVELLSDDVARLRTDIANIKEELEKERKKTEELMNLQKLESASSQKMGMEFLQKQIGMAIAKNKQFFTESGTVTVPDEAKFAIITAGAGGASGSHAIVDNDEIVAGAGGGAGSGILFYPIKINKSKIISFVVGKGGVLPSQNGGDTIIKYEDKTLTLGGGKGCLDPRGNIGGEGGVCDFDPICNGYSGNAGTEALYDKKNKDNDLAIGGSGGSSKFARGGIGGLKAFITNGDGKLIPSIKGLDAEGFSAGGGGSAAGIDKNLVGFGGSGFVYITFA